VVQGTWRGTPVAVKQLRFELADDPIATKDFQSEISLLSLLRHPNIILYMGAFEGTPTNLKDTLGGKDLPIIVFEWLEGGNLFNKIHGAASCCVFVGVVVVAVVGPTKDDSSWDGELQRLIPRVVAAPCSSSRPARVGARLPS
jgi:hypothetical protein